MKITTHQVRQIIKEELRLIFSEAFEGEDKWIAGKDSDFSGKKLFLVFLNDKHLDKEYPKFDGQNHGMVSHAIKHASEFAELNVQDDFNKFKSQIQNVISSGKDIYVRVKSGQYKINKTIIDLIQRFKNTPKDNREQKNKIKQELANETEIDVGKINNAMQLYANQLVPKLNNLRLEDFKAILDFHHDIGDLQSLDFFDGEMIKKYSKLTDKFIEDNKDGFQADPKDNLKKVAVKNIGNTNAASIVYNDKIATMYTDKSKSKPEDFFRK